MGQRDGAEGEREWRGRTERWAWGMSCVPRSYGDPCPDVLLSPRNRVYLVPGRAERWVSQGRYFCKYCRVWFADNKSVRTRRGLSARGSAQVPEVVEKRGVANEKKQHSLAKQMSEIEKARRGVRGLKADEGPS